MAKIANRMSEILKGMIMKKGSTMTVSTPFHDLVKLEEVRMMLYKIYLPRSMSRLPMTSEPRGGEGGVGGLGGNWTLAATEDDTRATARAETKTATVEARYFVMSMCCALIAGANQKSVRE